MGVFCLLVELHREGSAPAACAAGLFKGISQYLENPNKLNTRINQKYKTRWGRRVGSRRSQVQLNLLKLNPQNPAKYLLVLL